MSGWVLWGEYYPHGVCCADCGVALHEENARERAVDPGIPEDPWETASRFGEMSLAEQMERAAIKELVCSTCSGT